jgi:hypothetical protein
MEPGFCIYKHYTQGGNMKNISKFFGKPTLQKNMVPIMVIVFALIAGFLSTGCSKESKKVDNKITNNVKINVTGRVMTVTWDAVKNAEGYEIVTTSEGCSSGNRTINTKEGTAVSTRSGSAARNVVIGERNSISITLMAARGDPDIPMANAVTAKVKSLGVIRSGEENLDSDYSELVRYEVIK